MSATWWEVACNSDRTCRVDGPVATAAASGHRPDFIEACDELAAGF